MSTATRGFTLVTDVATLDVPRHIVEYLAGLLAAHRRRISTPRGSRALGPFRQAVLALRWLRERGCVHRLARDAGIPQATGYRYLHEAISVLAEQAPDLHAVLDRCRDQQMTHVILDGTLIRSDRVAGLRDNGNDLWFSQKHKAFGGNVQFLAAPDGTPLWVSDAEPASIPDITAARTHALPALYQAAAGGRRPWQTRGTSAPASASRSRSAGPRAGPSRHFTPTPAHATHSCAPSAPWANAPPPNSNNAGAPCSTSPSAPAGSAISPAQPLSSTRSGNDQR